MDDHVWAQTAAKRVDAKTSPRFQQGYVVSRFGKLLCLTGPNAGTEYDLTASNTVLGRASDADIQVDDQFASRHHAEIRMSDNAYQIRDLNSKNGVTLDGRRLALLPRPDTAVAETVPTAWNLLGPAGWSRQKV